jgi:hypothetical protein
MAAAVAHHRGVRNEDDVHSLSLGPSMTCRRVCSACARVQNAKVQSGRRSPWPLAHPSSIVIGCKRRGGGRFAVARTNVLLVQTACLCPQCVRTKLCCICCVAADGNDWWFYYLSKSHVALVLAIPSPSKMTCWR